jgi:hypothetical protein
VGAAVVGEDEVEGRREGSVVGAVPLDFLVMERGDWDEEELGPCHDLRKTVKTMSA